MNISLEPFIRIISTAGQTSKSRLPGSKTNVKIRWYATCHHGKGEMTMSNQYDVIMIGAGPSAIFCAYELKRNKPDMKFL